LILGQYQINSTTRRSIRNKYEVNSRDWLETKRAILRIFYDMGKPIEIKADKDSAFMYNALKLLLESGGVTLNITTSENGVSDVEGFHKSV